MNLETFIYECSACEHKSENATVKKWADGPTKRPCVNCCSSGTINYREKTSEEREADAISKASSVPAIKSGKYFDRKHVPEGFKEVLRNVKKNNPGSTIDI